MSSPPRMPTVLSGSPLHDEHRLKSEIDELRHHGYQVDHQKLADSGEDCLVISQTVTHHTYRTLRTYLVCTNNFPTDAPTAFVELEKRTGEKEEIEINSIKLKAWQESYRLVEIVEDIIKQLEGEKDILLTPRQINTPTRSSTVAAPTLVSDSPNSNWLLMLVGAVVVFLIVLVGVGLGVMTLLDNGESPNATNSQTGVLENGQQSMVIETPIASTPTQTYSPTSTSTPIFTPTPTNSPTPTPTFIPTPAFRFTAELVDLSNWASLRESLEILASTPSGKETNLVIITSKPGLQISIISQSNQEAQYLLTGVSGLAIAHLSADTYEVVAQETASFILTHQEGYYHKLQLIPAE